MSTDGAEGSPSAEPDSVRGPVSSVESGPVSGSGTDSDTAVEQPDTGHADTGHADTGHADTGQTPSDAAVTPEAGRRRSGRRRRRRRQSGVRALVEWVVVIGVALLVALGIRQFLFQPFWIPTGSMEDTLVAGDRVLVNKAAYHFHQIRRGDVVVFQRPQNWTVEETVKDLIKRVIALPGDEVTIRDCSVFIGGRRLIEPYVDGKCTEPASSVIDPDEDGTFVVPNKMIFVMGDNRTGSADSRVNGFVPKSDVVGRAFVLIWPLKHWRWL